MNNFAIVEINGDKYIILDILELENKKYILLAKIIDEIDINEEFQIYIYKDQYNYFDIIEDIDEYNHIKTIFEERLQKLKLELNKDNNINSNNIIKLNLINIKDDSYLFQKINGEEIILNLEFLNRFNLEINDKIYIQESTIQTNTVIRFGEIYNSNNEIIKIVRGNDSYYLQRY